MWRRGGDEGLKQRKPKRCCYNCDYGLEVASTPERALEFNSKRRVCSANYNLPTYPMYEKRSCKGFELSRKLPFRGMPYYYDTEVTAD